MHARHFNQDDSAFFIMCTREFWSFSPTGCKWQLSSSPYRSVASKYLDHKSCLSFVTDTMDNIPLSKREKDHLTAQHLSPSITIDNENLVLIGNFRLACRRSTIKRRSRCCRRCCCCCCCCCCGCCCGFTITCCLRRFGGGGSEWRSG